MPAPSGTFLAAKNGHVKFTGTALTAANWDVDDKGELLDVTNFESAGYGENILGVQEATWNVSGVWDSAKSPWSDPPGLYPRDDGVTMTFHVSSGITAFTFPKWSCHGSKITTTTKQTVNYNAGGKSQGIYNRS